MNIFEEEFRSISTRGIILSKAEMESIGIKTIFNAFMHQDYYSIKDPEGILEQHIRNGEFCLLEVAMGNNIIISSLITFRDIWSRNVYAMKNMEYYEGFPDLKTIYN